MFWFGLLAAFLPLKTVFAYLFTAAGAFRYVSFVFLREMAYFAEF